MSGDPLVAFLRARYDEEQAVVDAAAEDEGGDRWVYDPVLTDGPHAFALDNGEVHVEGHPTHRVTHDYEGLNFSVDPPAGRHIALHDPLWARRNLAAARRRLDLYEHARDARERHTGNACVAAGLDAVVHYLAVVVCGDAARYHDHSDYRPEWAL